MTWLKILEVIWGGMNSPVGVAATAGVILWLLNAVYERKPRWKQYEGAIIAGIKFAEKQIPDDAKDKSLRRLDEALRYVLGIYSQVNGRVANTKNTTILKEGIQITHARLEAAKTL